MTERMKGLLYAGGGVAFLSPDSLIIKMSGLDAPAMIFWRSLLAGSALFLALCLVWRGDIWRRFRAIGATGLSVALIYAISNCSFTAANTLTVAANVLVILATAPLFSAIFATIFLKEKTPRRVWIACAVAMVGVALVAGEQISLSAGVGEGFALLCVITISIVFVIIRATHRINMLPATAIGLALAAPIGLFYYAEPVGMIPWAYVVIGNLIFIPIAYMGITIGPRYLPPAETGLLMLLETALGSLWVWLVLAERPTDLGLIGGVIIMAAMIGNGLAGMRRRGRKSVAA